MHYSLKKVEDHLSKKLEDIETISIIDLNTRFGKIIYSSLSCKLILLTNEEQKFRTLRNFLVFNKLDFLISIK